MKEKYKSIEDLFGEESLKDYIKDNYYNNYTKWYEDIKTPIKTQEEIWQEQLEKMDISVVEKFLRKKKLENLEK